MGSSLHPTTWTSGKVWAGLKEVERAGFHVQYNGLDFMLKGGLHAQNAELRVQGLDLMYNGLDFMHSRLNFTDKGLYLQRA